MNIDKKMEDFGEEGYSFTLRTQVRVWVGGQSLE